MLKENCYAVCGDNTTLVTKPCLMSYNMLSEVLIYKGSLPSALAAFLGPNSPTSLALTIVHPRASQ